MGRSQQELPSSGQQRSKLKVHREFQLSKRSSSSFKHYVQDIQLPATAEATLLGRVQVAATVAVHCSHAASTATTEVVHNEANAEAMQSNSVPALGGRAEDLMDSSQSSPIGYTPTGQVDPDNCRCLTPSIPSCLGTGRKQGLEPVEEVDRSPCSSLAEQYLLMGEPDNSNVEWQGISLPWELSEHQSATHNFQCGSTSPDQPNLTSKNHQALYQQPHETAIPPTYHDLEGAESGVNLLVSNADRRLLPQAHPLPVLPPCSAAADPDDMSLAGLVALGQSEAGKEVQQSQASALALMLQGPGQQHVGSNLGAQAELQMSLIDCIAQAQEILACSQRPAHGSDSTADWILDDISARMIAHSQEQYPEASVLPSRPPAASGPVTDAHGYGHAQPPPATGQGAQPPEQGSVCWHQGLEVCFDAVKPSMTMPTGHLHLDLEQLSLPQINLGNDIPTFLSPKISPALLQWLPSCLLRMSLGGESDYFPLCNAQSAAAGQGSHDLAAPRRETANELASNKQDQAPKLLEERGLNGKDAACADEDWQPANKFFSSRDDADAQSPDAHWKPNTTEDNVALAVCSQRHNGSAAGCDNEREPAQVGELAEGQVETATAFPDAVGSSEQAAEAHQLSRSSRRSSHRLHLGAIAPESGDKDACTQRTGHQGGQPPTKRHKPGPSDADPARNELRTWLSGITEAAVDRLTQMRPPAAAQRQETSPELNTHSLVSGPFLHANAASPRGELGAPGTLRVATHCLQRDQYPLSSRRQTREAASATIIWQPVCEDAACKPAEQQAMLVRASNGSCKPASQIPSESCVTSLSHLASKSDPVAPQPGSARPRKDKECKVPASSPAAKACMPTAGDEKSSVKQGNRLMVASVHDGRHNTPQNTSYDRQAATAVANTWDKCTLDQDKHPTLAAAVPSKQDASERAGRRESDLKCTSSQGINGRTLAGPQAFASGTAGVAAATDRRAETLEAPCSQEVAAAVALAIRDLWSMLSTFDRLELASTFAGTSHMSQDAHNSGSVSPDLNTIRCKLQVYGASLAALQAFRADVHAMVDSCLRRYPFGDWGHNFGLLMRAFAEKRFSNAEAKIFRK